MSRISYTKNQHNRDCSAMQMMRQGDWNHPLFLKGDSVYATANGVVRKKGGGTTKFLIVRCNDPHCQFEVWINADVLEEYIYTNLLGDKQNGDQ